MSTGIRVTLKCIGLIIGAATVTGCNTAGIPFFTTNDTSAVLAAGESANTHFFTSEMNHDSGIALEAGARYTVDITILSHWIDSDIETNEADQPLDEKGFANSLMPWQWTGLTRRSQSHNWFELMLKQPGCSVLGVSDLENNDNGGYNFTANCSGQLRLFVNDTVGFYGNNVGYANITVSRLN